jgi:Predicted HD-superfamily hydrolase
MIKDYKNKTFGLIKGTFIISKIDYKPFSNKPGSFLACEFTDNSGSMKGFMWEGFAFYKSWLKNKIVVNIVGELNSYKGTVQIQLKSMSKAEIYNSTDFVPSLSSEKISCIEKDLKSFEESIKNEVCKKIWTELLCDSIGSLKLPYLHCPGGVGEVHHNYCGGLAEHSFSMMQIGESVSQQQNLDRDIVLTGCLIHDIGKIQCYNWNLVIEMSDAGRLLHHTYMGYGMLLEMAKKTDIQLNDPTFLKLAHIIVSHHEEEGIRKTMFPEANAVAKLDAMDAMITHANVYSTAPENKDGNSNWTKFCNLTQRQYYIPIFQEKIPDTPPQTPDTDIIDDLFGDK